MSGPVRSWDLPVVRALDAVEQLPGFRPDQIEWDSFQLHRTGRGEQMEAVSIYAYPTGSEHGFVRFGVTDGEFTVTDPERRRMTASDVAVALNVPTMSAEKAITAVIPALATALSRFNAAHAPHAAARAVNAGQGPVGSYNCHSGLSDQPQQPGIGL
ncbi:hypothetical protein [Rudaeicoccus suwonensis]|uniref:Uncharacterized protein n=1 Tax=Rudaeicoccus suwonensis TaxID=657409 RepID=A0A561EBU9_9MICO|nr:hypothetical protein [Rudaeicoccus suwonensis]TWE13084.1 hypothetical protein BKA23_1912 [Rudaeicoccus suwonensis]